MYYMISHLIEHRWHVTATLSDPSIMQRGKHYLDQWSLLEELSTTLKQQTTTSTVTTTVEPSTSVSLLSSLLESGGSSEEENKAKPDEDINSQVRN